MGKIFIKFISGLLVIHCIFYLQTIQTMAPLRNSPQKVRGLIKSSINTCLPTAQSKITPQFQKLTPQRKFSSFSNDKESNYQRFKQKAKRFEERNPYLTGIGLGLTATIGIAIIAEADEIADIALKTFNMAMFDEKLISSEFSDAIIMIMDPHAGAAGSALIIRSEHDPDRYFVLTAAHCVEKGPFFILIPPHDIPGSYLRVEPLIINRYRDIAVLLIPPFAIRHFKESRGRALPAIPTKQLSNMKPDKYEILSLQGYPSNTLYKEKLIPKLITKGSKQLDTPNYAGHLELIRSKKSMKKQEHLCGTSGGPIIALRNKQPQVLGIVSGGDYYSLFGPGVKRPGKTVYAAGAGELPDYLQEAEKRARCDTTNAKIENTDTDWLHWTPENQFSKLLGYK